MKKNITITPKLINSLCRTLVKSLKVLDGTYDKRVPRKNTYDYKSNDNEIISDDFQMRRQLKSLNSSVKIAIGKKLFIDQVQKRNYNLMRDDPQFGRLLNISQYQKKQLEPLYDFYNLQNLVIEQAQSEKEASQSRTSTFIKDNLHKSINLPRNSVSKLEDRIESILRFPATADDLKEVIESTHRVTLQNVTSVLDKLQSSSIVLVLRLKDPKVSNLDIIELQQLIDKMNNRILPNQRFVEFPKTPFAELNTLEDYSCLCGLQLAASYPSSSRPVNYQDLISMIEQSDKQSEFFKYMFQQFSDAADESIKKFLPALLRPELVDFIGNDTDSDNRKISNCITILKSFMRQFYMLSINLVDPENVKFLPDLFQLIDHMRAYSISVEFGQLNYYKTPFASQIADALLLESKIMTAKSTYESLLNSAQIDRLANENYFMRFLQELAKNNLSAISKGRECLYVGGPRDSLQPV